MKNRAKIYRNSKLEAKSNRKVILEALETDFGPQDGDFGGQEGDFGGKKKKGKLYEDIWDRSVEWRRPIAKLESSEYSWSTEKFHTPAILSRMRRI